MIIIGITGGISSGKSTIIKKLKNEKDFFVLDLDAVAKDVTRPGLPAYKEIRSYFGEEYIDAETGELLRKKLGDLIFNDFEAKKVLNRITHKYILKEIVKSLLREFVKGRKYFVFDAPLLIESKLNMICNVVIVISVPLDIQIDRLMNRDNISKSDAEKRINAQMSLEKKIKIRDIYP